MTTTAKVKSFIKQFIAIVNGDSTQQKAEKVFRSADSALNVQIASLTGDTIAFEDAVETAQENLAKAKLNNGEEITNRSSYVQNILNAKNALTTAQENKEKHEAKLAFLKEVLSDLNEEEDTEEAA